MLSQKVSNIIRCVNRELSGLDNTDRAMVILLVIDFLKVAVEMSIIDTYKTQKVETTLAGEQE